jgi:threonylcarbamoyladenosine tRNA methylthiotransferase MtaB
MKVYLDSIGCRLNQGEIEAYARQFRSQGHTLVSSASEADLVVVNTCTVTAAAASDSRQKIRQAARAGADEIVVTGCWSTLNPKGAELLPRVSRVVPNQDKDSLVREVLGISDQGYEIELLERERIPGARARTRSFIKVQDGCDNRCTFCITTIARGPGKSRPIQQIIEDIQIELQGDTTGSREIVLTGVHLGSWGQDFEKPLHLKNLVRAVLKETDAPRLRLSSLEPWDLDENFFQLWENERLCRHLHLPLQSGSAATLRRMARKTNPQEYARLVEAARRTIPEVAITTDIITGFPGEDEAAFLESLQFAENMHFSGGHAFTYSERPGTAAERMSGQVPERVRKERNARMRTMLLKSAETFRNAFIGSELPVLWESVTSVGPENWLISGLTDNYLRVYTESPRQLWNQITPVRLINLHKDGLFGYISR